jgi:GST-like protein
MKLYGEPGWGSVLAEAQLDWYGIDYDFERVGDLFKSADARQKLSKVNPIAQIPTLELADGTVMTESAAITLYLAELAGNDALVPAAGSTDRAMFLRWLIFIVANIYPTFTYGDEPSRFVAGREAQENFKQTVNEYAMKMFLVLEENARQPWFLGERFSALEIDLCTLSRWRARRPWFAANTSKLNAIAIACDEIEALRPAWQRNFPGA